MALSRAERLRRSVLKRAFKGKLALQDPISGGPAELAVTFASMRARKVPLEVVGEWL
jgi:hypothetical protein